MLTILGSLRSTSFAPLYAVSHSSLVFYLTMALRNTLTSTNHLPNESFFGYTSLRRCHSLPRSKAWGIAIFFNMLGVMRRLPKTSLTFVGFHRGFISLTLSTIRTYPIPFSLIYRVSQPLQISFSLLTITSERSMETPNDCSISVGHPGKEHHQTGLDPFSSRVSSRLYKQAYLRCS
jgi:hypothetical protein